MPPSSPTPSRLERQAHIRLVLLANDGNFEAQLRVNTLEARQIEHETAPRRLRSKSSFEAALAATRRLHGITLPDLAKRATTDPHRETIALIQTYLSNARDNAQARAFDIQVAHDVFVLLSQFLGLSIVPQKYPRKKQPTPSLTAAMQGSLAMRMVGDSINHINMKKRAERREASQNRQTQAQGPEQPQPPAQPAELSPQQPQFQPAHPQPPPQPASQLSTPFPNAIVPQPATHNPTIPPVAAASPPTTTPPFIPAPAATTRALSSTSNLKNPIPPPHPATAQPPSPDPPIDSTFLQAIPLVPVLNPHVTPAPVSPSPRRRPTLLQRSNASWKSRSSNQPTTPPPPPMTAAQAQAFAATTSDTSYPAQPPSTHPTPTQSQPYHLQPQPPHIPAQTAAPIYSHHIPHQPQPVPAPPVSQPVTSASHPPQTRPQTTHPVPTNTAHHPVQPLSKPAQPAPPPRPTFVQPMSHPHPHQPAPHNMHAMSQPMKPPPVSHPVQNAPHAAMPASQPVQGVQPVQPVQPVKPVQPVQPVLQTVQPVAAPAPQHPVVSQSMHFVPQTGHHSSQSVQYQVAQAPQGTAMYQPPVMMTTAQPAVQGTVVQGNEGGVAGGKTQGGGGMKKFQRVGSKVKTAFSKIRSRPKEGRGEAQPVGDGVYYDSGSYVQNSLEYPEVTVQNQQVVVTTDGAPVPGHGENVPVVLPEMQGEVSLEPVGKPAEWEVGVVSAEQAAPVEVVVGVESVDQVVPVDEVMSFEHAVPVGEDEAIVEEEPCAVAEFVAPVEHNAVYAEEEEVQEVQLAEAEEDPMAQITEHSSITEGLQQLFFGE